jgi:hypothetical protein
MNRCRFGFFFSGGMLHSGIILLLVAFDRHSRPAQFSVQVDEELLVP